MAQVRQGSAHTESVHASFLGVPPNVAVLPVHDITFRKCIDPSEDQYMAWVAGGENATVDDLDSNDASSLRKSTQTFARPIPRLFHSVCVVTMPPSLCQPGASGPIGIIEQTDPCSHNSREHRRRSPPSWTCTCPPMTPLARFDECDERQYSSHRRW